MPFRYALPARALHWLTVLAILAQVVLGFWITLFAPPDEASKMALYHVHENIGFTLLPLTLFRLGYRRAHPPAPLPGDIPAPMRLAAHATHAALYLGLLVMPYLGVMATTAWGFPFHWLGLIPIPSPFGHNEALAPLLSRLHEAGAWLLMLAIAAHAGGALFHALVRKDGVLQRML